MYCQPKCDIKPITVCRTASFTSMIFKLKTIDCLQLKEYTYIKHYVDLMALIIVTTVAELIGLIII